MIFRACLLCCLVNLCSISLFANNSLCDNRVSNLNLYQKSTQYDWKEQFVSKWYLPVHEIKDSNSGTPAGVALVVHGLNNPNSIMQGYVDIYTELGFAVLNVALAGHRGSEEEAYKVSAKLWRDEFRSHFCIALKKAKARGVNVQLLGFSLGGLLIVDQLLSDPEHKEYIDSAFLIAPGIILPWYTQWISKLSVFDQIRIPSFNDKRYRIEEGTTGQMYTASYDIISSLKGNTNKIKIPVTVVANDSDSVVNIPKTIEFLKTKTTNKIQILNVAGEGASIRNFNHIYVDNETAGPKDWQKIKANLIKFIKQTVNN